MVSVMSELSVGSVFRSAEPPCGTVGPVSISEAIQSLVDAPANPSANPSSGQDRPQSITDIIAPPQGVIDPETGVFVLQYKNAGTGEVTQQFPSEKVVDAYKRGAAHGVSAATLPATGLTAGTSLSV